jgi:FAD-dependent oxidoreductase family protein
MRPRELACDVLIVGGGLGGVAAALAATRRGLQAILTEETGWLGGQLTAQAVPPDEHPWIEQFGCTTTYRQLRDAIRAYYREWYPLTSAARRRRDLNPGEGAVSRLCHEPKVAVAVIEAMLAEPSSRGLLRVLRHHRPVAAAADDDRVRTVTVVDSDTARDLSISARCFLDATELGELLPMCGVEHVTGFESRNETGEPHAPATAQPANMQAISHCFAVDHIAGEDHTIEEPRGYAYWRDYRPNFWPARLLSLTAPDPQTLDPVVRRFLPNGPEPSPPDGDSEVPAGWDLWTFRRILSRRLFVEGFAESDITLVNWPMIDYFEGPLIGVELEEAGRNRDRARQLSLSFLYWLQTEAPRPDGGAGWRGLRLRHDVVDTVDGLARAPYIRESRRIRALYTVREQDVSLSVREGRGAVRYADSVGIGSYRIDLHPSTGGDNYIDVPACPFQIPLGSLIPRRVQNLLPAAKNIGTTHITNGCFRLHPVEWNVGEAAGSLVAYCLKRGYVPSRCVSSPGCWRSFSGG